MEQTMGEITAGTVINNGFYLIELIEDPRWDETHNRWMARGYRWLPSRKQWWAKPKLYGWDEDHNEAVPSPAAA